MKRIFIAVKADAGEILLNTVTSLKQRLSDESIKWTKLENIHITLVFLGDTEDEKISVVSQMLNEKCTGFGPFDLTLQGTGVFRNYSNPRVLWIGIEPSEKLGQLQAIVSNGLINIGITADLQPFNPHLTLGRIKKINDITALKLLIEEYRYSIFQKVHVEEVILYESILQQSGPIYKPIGKYSLAKVL
jgi:2'-5' RNA ligase